MSNINPSLLEKYDQRLKALNDGMRALEEIGTKVLEERQTKECTRCKDPKPLAAFSRHPKSKDGLQWWCRRCYASYQSDRRHKQKRRRQRGVADQLAYGLAYAIEESRRTHELPTVSGWQSQVDQGAYSPDRGMALGLIVGLALWMIGLGLVGVVLL